MDVVMLSRLQFAVAVVFHYLFVPLTLGLVVITAIMETIYVRTGDETYKRMAKFWGKLFLINFSVGVVTGLTLEFQFGTNWSQYSKYVGDIFGSLLAVEATLAFFLESTFIAVWFFGWNKLSKRMHCFSIWMVALGTNISAFWILVANSWMQHPVGYVIRNGRAELDDFMAIITQPYALNMFRHTLGGAYILAGFFVLGISAWHLLRKPADIFFLKSFRIAAIWTFVSVLMELGMGHFTAQYLYSVQPAKFAAMEAHWETQAGAPTYLLQFPNFNGDGNLFEALPIPKLMSFLATNDPNAVVKGLNDIPPEDRPPVWPVFLSFRLMIALGGLFLALSTYAVYSLWRGRLDPWFLRILVYTIPLPYIANEAGWMVTEIGRQPWLVYGVMRTADGVSPIQSSQVWVTLIGFILLYGLLGVLDFFLLAKFARRGPVN